MDEKEYRHELEYHDWYYDYTDDGAVWRRGHAAFKRIDAYRRDHDPHFKIWNEYAPDEWKVLNK